MSAYSKIYSVKSMAVFANGIYMVLPGLINQVLAYFVFIYGNSAIWGEVVQIQLGYYLSAAIIAWGNKDFLLVKFSELPGNVIINWQQSFLNRAIVLLLPIAVLSYIMHPGIVGIHVVFWLTLRIFSQSVESYVIFERSYSKAILAEIAALFPLIFIVFHKHNISVLNIVEIITLTHVFRVAVLLINYHELVKHINKAVIRFDEIKLSVPFMILAVLGFLQARIDLYCMGFFANKAAVGNYQVLISYVSLCLLIPGFIVTPYLKNIYRLNTSSYKKLQQKLTRFGVIIGVLSVGAIAVILKVIYRIDYGILIYLLSLFYTVTPYFIMLSVYKHYKHGKQKKVMIISLLSVVMNFIVCSALIPKFESTGAMIANCTSQMFLWIYYSISAKNEK